MIGRRRDRRPPAGEGENGSPRRRSGPAGEEPWWEPADQAVVERDLLSGADLGRGWYPVAMVNNAERLDPLGGDEDSAIIRAARDARRPTALDEGRAWRRRRDGALAVLRVEAFAVADDAAHRRAWRDHAEGSLDATWRERWVERGRRPGWVEACWVERDAGGGPAATDPAGSAAGAAVDEVRIEDHTDPEGRGAVTVYQHLTVWAGRFHATLTVRHGLDAEPPPAGAAAEHLAARLLAVTPPDTAR